MYINLNFGLDIFLPQFREYLVLFFWAYLWFFFYKFSTSFHSETFLIFNTPIDLETLLLIKSMLLEIKFFIKNNAWIGYKIFAN